MNGRKKSTATQRQGLNATVVEAPAEKTEQKKPLNVNLLVLGVYNTLVTTYGPRDDLLSPAVLDLVARNKGDAEREFNAFFLCTNMAYILKPAVTEGWRKKAGQTNKYEKSYTPEQIQANMEIRQVSRNFAAATGLKCLEISSAEDEISDHLGNGYQKVIRPGEVSYDLRDKIPASGTYVTYDQLHQDGDYKNHQLLRVAEFAAHKYPKATINITFVDDNTSTCNKAYMAYCNPERKKFSSIRLEAAPVALPARVSMRVLQHLAKIDEAPSLVEIPKGQTNTSVSEKSAKPVLATVIASPVVSGNIEPVMAKVVDESFYRPNSPLQANSMFKAATRPTTGALTLRADDNFYLQQKKQRRS